MFPIPSKINFEILLTEFSGSPSLADVNQNLRQKLASLAFQCLAYAIAGYAFYFLFFASQF